jgi:hypothetical protein
VYPEQELIELYYDSTFPDTSGWALTCAGLAVFGAAAIAGVRKSRQGTDS